MIGVKYALFAVLSVGVNLSFQYATFSFYRGFLAIYVAMFVGTIAGLICKYILDKKYIFFHKPENIEDDMRSFVLYSLVGAALTLVFWVFEVAFDAIFDGELAKYVGAVIGLTIGYTLKYFLDRKYVFPVSGNSR
jgi:putative flippase GtrA